MCLHLNACAPFFMLDSNSKTIFIKPVIRMFHDGAQNSCISRTLFVLMQYQIHNGTSFYLVA